MVEHCNPDEIVKYRFRSIAKGVGGTGIIIGRVHLADLKVCCVNVC